MMLREFIGIVITVTFFGFPIYVYYCADPSIKIFTNNSVNMQLFENGDELAKRLKHGQHLTDTEKIFQIYTSYHRGTEVTMNIFVALMWVMVELVGTFLFVTMINHFLVLELNVEMGFAICLILTSIICVPGVIRNTKPFAEKRHTKKEEEYFANLGRILNAIEIDYDLRSLKHNLFVVDSEIDKLKEKKENSLVFKVTTLFMIPILVFSTEQLLSALINNGIYIYRFISTKENWFLFWDIIQNVTPILFALIVVIGFFTQVMRRLLLPTIRQTYFLDQSLTLNQAIIAKRILQRTIYEFNAEPKLLSMQ